MGSLHGLNARMYLVSHYRQGVLISGWLVEVSTLIKTITNVLKKVTGVREGKSLSEYTDSGQRTRVWSALRSSDPLRRAGQPLQVSSLNSNPGIGGAGLRW